MTQSRDPIDDKLSVMPAKNYGCTCSVISLLGCMYARVLHTKLWLPETH